MWPTIQNNQEKKCQKDKQWTINTAQKTKDYAT